MNIKIGFIGYGNMAQAIAKGLVFKKVVKPNQIFANALHYDKLCINTKKIEINPIKNIDELIKKVDYVILAVKPNQIENIVKVYKNQLKDKVLISIAGGLNYDFYKKILASNSAHLSIIPNTPIAVGEGIVICEEKHSLNQKQLLIFKKIFSQLAYVKFVKSNQFSIASTISGCAPAFTAIYLEALADAAVKYGLERNEAYVLAAKMVVGTGKLYLQEQQHPGIIKDNVCSPGGSTIRGVSSLEKNGFRGLIIKAIDEIEES